MENIDLQEYIKDLTPEQKEKALKCKTNAELLQLAADEDLEVPMDALEGVAGGLGACDPNEGQATADQEIKGALCPVCGAQLYKNGTGPASIVPPADPDGTEYGYCKQCAKYQPINKKGQGSMDKNLMARI
ncbi:MAG: hypothetical protein IJM75_08960 [Ruminococcus sp.]|nr:hypothetical protein [Ruminococcus sp.]